MEEAVVVRGLVKRFGPRRAIDGIDLRIASGEFLSLFGPNGAGKTTLVRVLATLSRASSGEATLFGCPLMQAPPSIRARIGVVSHRSFLYGELSGRENLTFYARMFAILDVARRVDAVADAVGIRDRLDDPVRTYSRGLTQRCAIARALVHDPELLLFDEPFSGLDPIAAQRLREVLERAHAGGRTVLMTSHDLRGGLALADRVAIVRRGRIVHEGDGTTPHEKLEAIYRGAVSS